MSERNTWSEKILTKEGVERLANGKREEITSFVIPDDVTAIGEGAFSDCIGLTSVTIPNTVTNIEKAAFFHCKGLMYMKLPASVKRIDDWAFLDCPNLKEHRGRFSVLTIFA